MTTCPVLTKRRLLAAKIETVIGTAETLLAANSGFNAMNVVVNSDIEFEDRDAEGAFSKLPGQLGAYGAKVDFEVQLVGDGAGGKPNWADVLLPACGMVDPDDNDSFVLQTLAPGCSGSNTKTITIGIYEDGLFKRLRGCMGTFEVMYESGKPITLKFTFWGVWEVPQQNVSLLSVSLPTLVPLRWNGGTFTIGGATPPQVGEFKIGLNGDVIMRPALTEAGYLAALLTDRRVAGQFTPESRGDASWAPGAALLNKTTGALVLTVTDGTDTVSVAGPALQYTNVQEGDRDGLQIDTIDFLMATGGTADDELTITWS